MSTVFWHNVGTKAAQMEDSQRQEVRAAIKAGATPTFLGRYAPRACLVLRVTMPDTWHGESYDRFRHLGLSCLIPPDREEATRAWVARHTTE